MSKSERPPPIPFNRPHLTGEELGNIAQAHAQGRLSGDGPFTQRCHQWLSQHCEGRKALLTHSATAALEMAALLLEIAPGDEILMPSFTFVSTANAFVLRGGVPVFCDIRADTLNLDETLIEAAITPRTRAIVAVHYAGVGCAMEVLRAIAQRHRLALVEDAAQGLCARYQGRPLGAIGDFGAFSFHETKNIISGEGGALIVGAAQPAQRAEILREKGTDRSRFARGEVDKYTWQDIGSSYLPGEMTAAFLWAQLQQAEALTRARLVLWQRYHERLEAAEQRGLLRRPIISEEAQHNAHLYYVLLNAESPRAAVLEHCRAEGVGALFHYVPLHSSPAGRRFGRAQGALKNTESLSSRLVRLPLWHGISEGEQERVVSVLLRAIDQAATRTGAA